VKKKLPIIIIIIIYDYIHGSSVNEIMQFVITRFGLNVTDLLQGREWVKFDN